MGFSYRLGVINGPVIFNIFHNNLIPDQYIQILQNYVNQTLENMGITGSEEFWLSGLQARQTLRILISVFGDTS